MRKSHDNNIQCLRSISCNKEVLGIGRSVKYFVTFLCLVTSTHMQLNDSSTDQTGHCVFRIPHHTFLALARNCNGEEWRCKLEILQFSDVQEFQIWGCRSNALARQNWNSQRAEVGVSFWCLYQNFSLSFFFINKVFCLLMRQHQINSRKSNIYTIAFVPLMSTVLTI